MRIARSAETCEARISAYIISHISIFFNILLVIFQKSLVRAVQLIDLIQNKEICATERTKCASRSAGAEHIVQKKMPLFFDSLYTPNCQMEQHFYGKKQYYIQYRHNKRSDCPGNGVERIAHNEKPIKKVRISVAFSVIHAVSEQRPKSHT